MSNSEAQSGAKPRPNKVGSTEFDTVIRVGEEYQAVIPDFIGKGQPYPEEPSSEKNDTLLWAPIPETIVSMKQMNNYLNYAKRAAVKTSCNNVEHAIHILHHAKGDIIKAKSLLASSTGPQLPAVHAMRNYNYPGCQSWTPEEIKIFNRSIKHRCHTLKAISKMIRTKTHKECVQFFYGRKKPLITSVQAIDDNAHSTRGNARRAAEAAMEQAIKAAAEAHGTRDLDLPDDYLTVPCDDSSLRQVSVERSEEEMICEGPRAGSVILEIPVTSQMPQPSYGATFPFPALSEESPAVHALPFPCLFEGCCMGFLTKRDLRSHLLKHKKKSQPSPSTPVQQKMKEPTPATCPMNEPDRETVFSCTQCNRVFATVKSRNAHMRCHKVAKTP